MVDIKLDDINDTKVLKSFINSNTELLELLTAVNGLYHIQKLYVYRFVSSGNYNEPQHPVVTLMMVADGCDWEQLDAVTKEVLPDYDRHLSCGILGFDLIPEIAENMSKYNGYVDMTEEVHYGRVQ